MNPFVLFNAHEYLGKYGGSMEFFLKNNQKILSIICMSHVVLLIPHRRNACRNSNPTRHTRTKTNPQRLLKVIYVHVLHITNWIEFKGSRFGTTMDYKCAISVRANPIGSTAALRYCSSGQTSCARCMINLHHSNTILSPDTNAGMFWIFVNEWYSYANKYSAILLYLLRI